MDVVFSFFKMVKEHPECCDCKHAKKQVVLECVEREIQDHVSIACLEAKAFYHLESHKIKHELSDGVKLELRIFMGNV